MSTPITVDVDVPKSRLKHMAPMRGRFTHHRVHALMKEIYDEKEFEAMKEAGVDKRMMFGTNPHYQALTMGEELRDPDGNILVPKMPPSMPIAAVILPRLDEALDMDGEKDPSNQMKYTSDDDETHGKLLHKYDEIVLGYASPTCSAHCRYCYRLDLFNKDTGKQSIRPEQLRNYVVAYNNHLERNGGVDPKTGEKRFPIREILLSGGDPLVLTNHLLYRFLVAAGQAGVHVIRLGSKEPAFRPQRLDEAFVEMLKLVHERFPHMHVNIVSHFTHPDEFLLRDDNNNYIPNENGGPGYKWMDVSRDAVRRVLSLPFVTIENQTPIIYRVNDSSEALRILHEELRRMGVKPKYIFQGREIEGHRAFSVPVEHSWNLHNNAMKGLSDTARSRFAMSTEWGKMEIISMIDGFDALKQAAGDMPSEMGAVLAELFGDGLIFFKTHRSPHEAATAGDLVIAKRNPEALWISGYEDRIIYDSRNPNQKYGGLVKILVDTMRKQIMDDVIPGSSSREAEEKVFAYAAAE